MLQGPSLSKPPHTQAHRPQNWRQTLKIHPATNLGHSKRGNKGQPRGVVAEKTFVATIHLVELVLLYQTVEENMAIQCSTASTMARKVADSTMELYEQGFEFGNTNHSI